jgi:tRNA pseudouridine13 synthase
LVYEVDLDGNVVHIKSLGMPDSAKKSKTTETHELVDTSIPLAPPAQATSAKTSTQAMDVDPTSTIMSEPAGSVEAKTDTSNDIPASTTSGDSAIPENTEKKGDASTALEGDEPWPERFTEALSPYLSEEAIMKLKEMYLEGPEPPFVSDSGWGGRSTAKDGSNAEAGPSSANESTSGGRGRGRGRGQRGRGGRGGKGGSRPEPRPDSRKVLSDVRISSCLRFHSRMIMKLDLIASGLAY